MSLFGLFNSSNIPQMDAEQLRQRMQKEKLFILDVREIFEHQSQKIPGSTLIPLGELPQRLSELEITVTKRSSYTAEAEAEA